MREAQETIWLADDDVELDREFADVIDLVRKHQPEALVPPRALDRQVRSLAAQQNSPAWKDAWILGQGPLVIMVTCILFAIAMLVIMLV